MNVKFKSSEIEKELKKSYVSAKKYKEELTKKKNSFEKEIDKSKGVHTEKVKQLKIETLQLERIVEGLVEYARTLRILTDNHPYPKEGILIKIPDFEFVERYQKSGQEAFEFVEQANVLAFKLGNLEPTFEEDMKTIFEKSYGLKMKNYGKKILSAMHFAKTKAIGLSETALKNEFLKKAFVTNGIFINIIKTENDKFTFVTSKGLKIEIPQNFKEPIADKLFQILLSKNFKALESYLNRFFHDERMLQKSAKKRNEQGTYFLPLKNLTLTTKGFYIVVGEDKYKQPLMIGWEGKVLTKKQGKKIKTLYRN